MFCVSTPSTSNGSVNLDNIISAIANYGKYLKEMQKDIWPLIVIRSTVPPGTTRRILLPILEKHSGMTAGKDFGLCMQPEFLRAKSSEEDFLNPWVTVIGELNLHSGKILADLYSDFGGEIFRVSLETAEFEKYVHNIFNATKISFANQIWLTVRSINEKFGINIDANQVLKITAKTAEGSWNQFYGTKGGRPYGGSCLPKDIKGFIEFLKEQGLPNAPLIDETDKINSIMERLADKNIVPCATEEGLNWKQSPVFLRYPNGLKKKRSEIGGV